MATMSDYLRDIEYAASNLIILLWKERATLASLHAALGRLDRQAAEGYSRAAFLAENFDDPDDVMLATAGYWDTYFGADKEAHGTRLQIPNIEAALETHDASVAALAGAVLQLAKQGMSIVNGALTNSPTGRKIGSQPLKSVIWQARNQAQHWEMGQLNQQTTSCFETLAADFDPKFRDYLTRSLAMDVVELLEWKAFSDFQHDLASLG
jgi:hypothetical protein